MGDQRGTMSLVMEGKRRPSSLSRDRCNSHASQRLTGGVAADHRGSRSNMKPEVGECWIQDSCQGGVVQYCNNSHGSSRATTPSQIQRSATLQGAKEGQELYDSMKRAMEKKLRENRHSCQDQTTSTNFWKPVCRKDPETETKRNDVYELVPRLPSPISTKDELLRVYRESIRRGELASMCMKTKKGRETLTLSVMMKSQESQAVQNQGYREEPLDCYVSPETFPDYLPMSSKVKTEYNHEETVQIAQGGVDFVKHHHH